MKQSKRDYCLFFYIKEDKLQGLFIFHVNDFLSSGTEMFEKDVMSPLKEKYAFGKSISRDFIYTGIHFLQNDDNEIYIDQDEFVDKLETFEYHGKDNDK